jgi:CRISPR system Cascade subunit CasC
MKQLLELHILQNFAPSNLNRDDTGSPKDAIFGGYRRARVSSQSFKRAIREYVLDNPNGLPDEAMAFRTKRLMQELVKKLVDKGRTEPEAKEKVVIALGGLGFKVDAEGKTEYLLFLGKLEVVRIAELIHKHWNDLVVQSEEDSKKKVKDAKKDARNAVKGELKSALIEVLNGGKALDVALFGRMLADLPEKNQYAACQVAHAISTNAVEREFDFYTAIDDLKRDDTSGADMLGTVEFNSACFYRYAALDLELLHKNLQGDAELMIQGLKTFLRAMVKAKPSGKQNSFAAHNDPEYVIVTVRTDADPRSLANAFEKPIRPSRNESQSLTEASVQQLEAKWKKLDTAYGQDGQVFVLNLTDLKPQVGKSASNLDDLINLSIKATQASLED